MPIMPNAGPPRARIIGGCCGISPRHIKCLKDRLADNGLGTADDIAFKKERLKASLS